MYIRASSVSFKFLCDTGQITLLSEPRFLCPWFLYRVVWTELNNIIKIPSSVAGTGKEILAVSLF